MAERTVVVTGASRGIGARIAGRFLTAGDRVICLDIVAPDPSSGVEHREVDIRDCESVRRAFESLDRVDVLVNNAGIQRVGLVGKQPVTEWLEVLNTHLVGAYFASRAAIDLMPEGGSIVFIASTVSFIALPGRSAYAAAKSGMLGLMRVLSLELADRGIRVNAVCPGFTRTQIIQQGIENGSLTTDWMLERVPLGRLAETSEIANAVGFLASDDASFITGQSLVVDGGWTIQGINRAPDWLRGSTSEAR